MTERNLQLRETEADIIPRFNLTKTIETQYFDSGMKKGNKDVKPATKTVTFIPSPEETAIIEAGKNKHGLKKTIDVIRMALRRFAEYEKGELKAS